VKSLDTILETLKHLNQRLDAINDDVTVALVKTGNAELAHMTGISEYLDYLSSNRQKFIICVCVCNVPGLVQPEARMVQEQLSQLGLENFPVSNCHHAYSAIIDGKDVCESAKSDVENADAVAVINGTRFAAHSRSTYVTIFVDKFQVPTNVPQVVERGTHFVVYDKVAATIIDHVVFDFESASFPSHRTDAGLAVMNTAIKQVQDKLVGSIKETDSMFWARYANLRGDGLENRLDFFRHMPSASGGLRVLQDGERALLFYFADFCALHNLQFWLIAGTALGAVRHEGFVPWDDDVDLAMLRTDYQRLIELIASDDQIMLETVYERGYPNKILLRKWGFGFLNLDVFVFDFIPSDEASQLRYLDFLKEVGGDVKRYGSARHGFDRAMHEFLCEDFERRVNPLGKREIVAMGFDNSWDRIVASVNHRYEDVFPLSECTFEGRAFLTFHNPIVALETQYKTPFELPTSLTLNQHTRINAAYLNSVRKYLDEIGGVADE